MKVPNDILLPEVCRLIAEGHAVTIRAHGNSMRPLLEGGRDKVVLSRCTQLRKGDLVLAEVAPRQYVLHRIIKFDQHGSEILLMGDGNISPERCKATNVTGTAIEVIRNGKRYDCSKLGVYGFLWTTLLPIRRYLLPAYAIITRNRNVQ